MAIAWAIRSYGHSAPRIGYQAGSPTLPIAFLNRLQRTGPEASWTDTTRLIWDQCAIKSPRELEYMRQAATINTIALDRAIAAIAPGVSDNMIAAALYAGMLEAGSNPMTHFQLASGPRTAVVHATHNDRRLEADDVVHFEFSAVRFRYTAPLMRTVALGRSSPAVQRLHNGALTTIWEGSPQGRWTQPPTPRLSATGCASFTVTGRIHGRNGR